MSMTNIVPELWAKEIVLLLQKTSVSGALANMNIAGEIKEKGDQVHIIGAGDVTIDDYPDSANITYADPSDTDTILTINKDKYFALKIEDKARKQAAVSWEQVYAARGAYKLRDAVDTNFFTEGYTNAGLANYETGTTAWQLGAAGADVPALCASIHKQLDDVDAPQENRYFAMNTICKQAFTLYFAARATGEGDNVAVNGFFKKAFGLELFVSRNVYNDGSASWGLAGTKMDNIAYGAQINPDEIEALRLEGRFATGVRGRALFGHKTYRTGTLVKVALNNTLLA